MVGRVLVAFICGAWLGCSWVSPGIPPGAVRLSDDVFVLPLDENLWRHVSYRTFAAGPYPSNGLIQDTGDGALIVDTAWNDEQTERLLDWAALRFGRVRALVVTHAHDDRMGGIAAVHARGVPSYGLASTSELGQKQGWPALTYTFQGSMPLEPLGVEGEVFYPGPGHTVDNVVVWLDPVKTLFGTCLVRAKASRIGNTRDAVLADWAGSIGAIEARFPSVRRVVPGHGDPGGPGLLGHTRRLAEAAALP